MSESAKKPTSRRRKILYGVAAFIAVCWFIAGFDDTETTKQIAVPAPAQQVSATFDVPSLLGKDVDGVRAALGAPRDDSEPTKQQLEFGVEEWEKLFEKDGRALLVTYNPQTRAVVDFFISTSDPSGVTKDKTSLLRTGNLQENDTRYQIEYVQQRGNNFRFTGVKITPL